VVICTFIVSHDQPGAYLMLAWMILNSVYLAVSLPSYYQRRQSLEPGNLTRTAFNGWTTQQIQAAMLELDLQPEIVVAAMFSASLICLGCFWIVAGLLFWRKSDTWVGLLAAFILFMTGPGFSGMLPHPISRSALDHSTQYFPRGDRLADVFCFFIPLPKMGNLSHPSLATCLSCLTWCFCQI